MPLPPTAVLMGGISPERGVSLASGRNVASGLAEGGIPRVIPVEILPDRSWRIGDIDPLPPGRALAALREMGTGCIFLALHGPGGEDGSIQGFLETVGIPYTCSGVSASALAMSKSASRALFRSEGIPLAPGIEIRRPSPDLVRKSVEEVCGYPCFLKEDASGSSIGVHRLSGPGDLEALLPRLAGVSGPLVAEKAVPGMEATVAVLGNRGSDLQALPPVEIRPRKEFFDYQAKYDPEWTEEICPPRSIHGEDQELLMELALKVHAALGCDGVSRTDFILGPSGPVVLECNTIPGLTRESLLPKAALAAGISFPELVVRLVRLALERDQESIRGGPGW